MTSHVSSDGTRVTPSSGASSSGDSSNLQSTLSAAAAGLITQTDASGRPKLSAIDNNSSLRLLAQHRQLEQSDFARQSKHVSRIGASGAAINGDGHVHGSAYGKSTNSSASGQSYAGLCCRICNILLGICCCIPSDEDLRYTTGYSRSSTNLAVAALLPRQLPEMRGRKCLILDLDETLVHSSFKPVPNPDYVIPVEIDGTVHRIYVIKRPGVDLFLEKLGKIYEIVVFTASLSKYADPLLDMLDINHVIQARLFRESCTVHQGNYVKDLDLIGRAKRSLIIVDNSPASYAFQPENAIGVSTFIDDMEDRELYYCLSFLESIVGEDDVTRCLQMYAKFIAQQAQLHASRSSQSASLPSSQLPFKA